jgi:hypothetical protein
MSKPLKKSALDMIAEATGAVAVPEAASNSEIAKPRNVTKANVKQMTLYLSGPAYRQLREIAFNEDTKMHPLILEGLDMLFKSRGRPELARSEGKK